MKTKAKAQSTPRSLPGPKTLETPGNPEGCLMGEIIALPRVLVDFSPHCNLNVKIFVWAKQ
jgi:hypothetical protein